MKKEMKSVITIFVSAVFVFCFESFFSACNAEPNPARIVIIQIDSMHPEYINLNSTASGEGSEGDWLMPKVRAFVEKSAYWPLAKAHFPQTTDSNVLSIISSSNSGTTGIYGVNKQPESWGPLQMLRKKNHLSKARYPSGDQVRTIFDAIKEQVPGANVAFLSNKKWVPEEYGSNEDMSSSVDIMINGVTYPPYIQTPEYVSFFDNPATDVDAFCDPESKEQTFVFDFFKNFPYLHPRDFWIADAAVKVMEQEAPEMMYVLLGDLDHGQHLLGEIHDPMEWKLGSPPSLPAGCEDQDHYRWINKRNEKLYKEPILDLIRDVDLAFGQLIEVFENGGYLQDAVVILVSDHNMENYLHREGIEQDTDVTVKLEDSGLAPRYNYGIYNRGSVGFLFWRPRYKFFNPFVVWEAKQELLDERHMALNHVTGVWEIPWDILNRRDMRLGRPDLGIDAMEIYHDYFVKNGLWPDLIVVMKKGWQLHNYSFLLDGEENWMLNKAGHGTPNTSQVMLAIRGMGFPEGVSCGEEVKLFDVAATISNYLEWSFPEEAGRVLTCEN